MSKRGCSGGSDGCKSPLQHCLVVVQYVHTAQRGADGGTYRQNIVLTSESIQCAFSGTSTIIISTIHSLTFLSRPPSPSPPLLLSSPSLPHSPPPPPPPPPHPLTPHPPSCQPAERGDSWRSAAGVRDCLPHRSGWGHCHPSTLPVGSLHTQWTLQ